MALTKPVAFAGPGTLILGLAATGDVYSCDLASAVLTDTTESLTATTGCGEVEALGADKWELSLQVVQDLETVDSLLLKSWELHGTDSPFIFIPNKRQAAAADISPTVPAFQGTTKVRRLSVGAAATALALSDSTWKCNGVTMITTPPAP